MKIFSDRTPTIQLEPATPRTPVSAAMREIASGAEWRLELHKRGREFPITLKPKETRIPTAGEVRRAKAPAHSKFENIDGYFVNRRRHAMDDPY